LVQLQAEIDNLHQAGIEVIGISPDEVDKLKTFTDDEQITFPLLSDAGSETINAFEIQFQRGLPHPGTFVIDKQGVIRAKLFRDGYRERHDVQELLKAAQAIQ